MLDFLYRNEMQKREKELFFNIFFMYNDKKIPAPTWNRTFLYLFINYLLDQRRAGHSIGAP
jgi:hypothetical protein